MSEQMREGKIVLEKDCFTAVVVEGGGGSRNKLQALKTPASGGGGLMARSWECRSLSSLLPPHRGPLAPAEMRLH